MSSKQQKHLLKHMLDTQDLCRYRLLQNKHGANRIATFLEKGVSQQLLYMAISLRMLGYAHWMDFVRVGGCWWRLTWHLVGLMWIVSHVFIRLTERIRRLCASYWSNRSSRRYRTAIAFCSPDEAEYLLILKRRLPCKYQT